MNAPLIRSKVQGQSGPEELDDLLPALKPIPGLSDGIEETLAQIRGEIDAATRKARRDEPWHSKRCSCPRCMVIG